MSSLLDKNGKPAKYGPTKHEEIAVCPRAMHASEVIPVGGAFMKEDGSGYLQVLTASDSLISGWGFMGEVGPDAGKAYQTCSSSAGGTKVPYLAAENMQTAVFRIPIITGTLTQAMFGETCDIKVDSTSKQQGADLTASSRDCVRIINGDLINNAWVDVVIATNKLTGWTGVV